MAVNLAYSAAAEADPTTQNRPRRLKEFDDVTLPAGQRVEARRVRIADIPLLLGRGEAGMGVAILPRIVVERAAAAGRIRTVRVTGIDFTRPFSIIRLRERTPSPLAQRFLTMLRGGE